MEPGHRQRANWQTALSLSLLGWAAMACASLQPIQPATSIGGRSAAGSELVLPQACQLLPGGAPTGRPDGVRSHTLPAGRYAAAFQDGDGVYFASPAGIVVVEPAPRGTRTRPGGVYVLAQTLQGFEYLGDADRVGSRHILPRRCAFTLEAREERPAP